MSFFKKIFQSKEEVFVQRLIEQAKIGVEGVNALKNFMTNNSKEDAEKVLKAEKEADEVRRILVDEINRSFVTPFDREDIYALSRAIDDIIDYAKTTVDEMHLLGVKPNDNLLKMTSLLFDAAQEVYLAMQRLLEHPNVANDHAQRIKNIENKIEFAYREALADLFKSPKDINDVVNMLKLREIYRHLANAGDRADEAANIICDIVVKST